MYFWLLVGYGAGAINPYLTFATIAGMIHDDQLKGVTEEEAVEHFVKALRKSLIKVASKMGISTVQSYRGAQIFEAIGLGKEVVDQYFTWTASRVGGVGLDIIARESANRHKVAYNADPNLDGELDVGGQYQWRRRGEFPMYNPNTIAKLQHSGPSGNYPLFKQYPKLLPQQNHTFPTLQTLPQFKTAP